MKHAKRSSLLLGIVVLSFTVAGLKAAPTGTDVGNASVVPVAKRDTLNLNFNFHFPSYAVVCHITHNFVTTLEDDRVVDTVHAGNGTDWVAILDSLDEVYIANFNSNDIAIIQQKAPHERTMIPAGEHPVCVRFTPDERTALISHQSPDGLWFMDTRTHAVTAKISEGTGLLYYLKSRNVFYQPAIFRPFVHIIDPVSQKITKSVWVGGRPMSLAFTPNGKYAYIPNYDLKEVQIMDTRLDSVVKVIPDISDARGIAITPDGKYALVTNVTSNTLTVIGIDSNAVVKVIPVDKMPTDVEVTHDGESAYVANQGSGSITVINLAKLEVTVHIEVPDNPITIFLF